MDIREIRSDELVKLLGLYTHLHDDDTIPEPHVISKVWAEIQTNKNIKYFGVFEEEDLISSCTIVIVPNLTRSCRPYAVIENVVTHIEHRRKGHGVSVLKAAIDFAWKKDCYKVMLMTGRLNEETLRFYESAGFDRKTKQAFVIKRA
ncbi:MAG: GNAT family N-acetyltransferase [Desulfatiglans sp.]|jgi:GNAT superfamily N-acetyltransferase|nr:GNAT family N-acetyltransferase [Desulfatiglans sp.]